MNPRGRGYTRFWHDLNRELWRAARDGAPPREFIRAELLRQVAHTEAVAKSAAVRMAHRAKPVSAECRACKWLAGEGAPDRLGYAGTLGSPSDIVLPENAAARSGVVNVFPGVGGSWQYGAAAPQVVVSARNYDLFVNAFRCAAAAAKNAGLDCSNISLSFGFKHRWIVEGTGGNPFKNITLNFFYITAPPKIWNAVFDAITTHRASSRRIAEQYAMSDAAQILLAVYADLSPLKVHDVYNLSEMFDELNDAYFGGRIPKPILAWTTRAQYTTLGTYDFHWDIIRISKALNDRRVPEFAVRFVLYHEMLHIKHGAVRENNRLISHTQAFREDERKFPMYEEAEGVCGKLRQIVKNLK